MAEIVVDTYKLKRYAQRLSAVNARIAKLDVRLNCLYNKVGLLGLFNLIQADAMTCYSWRLNRAQTYLNQTAVDFESAEQAVIRGEMQGHLISYAGTWINSIVATSIGGDLPHLIHPGPDVPVVLMGIISGAVWWDEHVYLEPLKAESAVGRDLKYGEYKDKDVLGDEDRLGVNVDQTKIPIYKINEEEKWYSKKGTIYEEKLFEAKAEGNVMSAQFSGEAEYAQGRVDVDLLTAEAHAEATAGFYVYTKDKDGNVKKVFAPNVTAEIGGSTAVVQVEAEGRVGLGEDNNMLGVYGDASATVLSAEAEGKLSIGPNEVYAGASAEADIAKVTGTAGVAVLGTDVGITGSLKVGVGGHAKAGYTDGKLKVDVGLAIGVGFDLGFEVDVSGTVDAVSDAAEAAWAFVEDTWDAALDFFTGW